MAERYLIALGSNQRHSRHGRPAAVLAAALRELELAGITIAATSPVVSSLPLGPSARRYANAAALVECTLQPLELLELLQGIEDALGRRRRGRRWRERVIDLDIALWSGGCWADDALIIPHPGLRHRLFVLGPAITVSGTWRDPLTALTLRHLHARLTRPRPAPKSPAIRPVRRAGP